MKTPKAGKTLPHSQLVRDLNKVGWSEERLRQLIADVSTIENVQQISEDSANSIKDYLFQFYELIIRLFALGQPSLVAEIRQKLAMGEGQNIEFKSTMKWDVKEQRKSRDIEKSIAKTIAGFMNSEGGTLFIGVDDEGNIVGLDYDFAALGRQDQDKFLQVFVQLVSNTIGKEFLQFVRETTFVPIDGKVIFVATVAKSHQPACVVDRGEPEFYVRVHNTTRLLNTREALEYSKMHWPLQSR